MLGTILFVVDGLPLGTCDGTVLGSFGGFIDGAVVGKFEVLLLGA